MIEGPLRDARVCQRWRDRPDIMVRELFNVQPDPWQDEALRAFPTTPRIAMKACKGPGKTTVLAWIAWNYLITRPHPNIAATSISGQNLADGLWKEMAKWQHASERLREQFTWTKTRITYNASPETWFMSARTWRADADATQQAATLAGFHADYVLFLIDESGGAPDALMPTAEAAFAGTLECHIVQAGNPSMLSGPLYTACTRAKALWKVIEITGDPDNPKRSSRIPIEHAREQIKLYGADNPWVLVNIFGRFPPSSLNVLIGPDEVSDSMNRYYREHEIGQTPRILGVDVARFGDDSSVICRRQGIQMMPLNKYRNLDSTQGAGITARIWNDWNADTCFLDATGGFGAGWLDQLHLLGKAPVGVQFAGKPNIDRYHNKRAEMAFDLVQWIRNGGALPKDDQLLSALTQTTYSFQRDRILLEPKEDIKARLGFSPDEFDACMLTLAQPVTATRVVRGRQASAMPANYDPFADMNRVDRNQQPYDPFRGM